MKDCADRNPLLDDLLDDGETLRASSLERGLAALRRKKRSRQMRPVLWSGAAALLAAALAWWPHETKMKPEVATVTVAEPLPAQSLAAAQKETKIQIISEDELLEQFPERAVAIVGPEDHRQLVFLDVAVTADVANLNDQH
jgi:hypothetical protein